MNRAIAITFALLLPTLVAVGAALAHEGGEQHIMGTVQKIADDSLVVETTKKELVSVSIASDTRFLRSGEPATLKDLKRGDRVAIDVDAHGGKPVAKVVKFGAPQKMQH